MSKRAPSTLQLVVIAGFALSCFGILLFLWVTFGGSTPFRAKAWEVKIPFDEATQLAEQSDVRISGVNVGKVQNIDLAPDGEQAIATVSIDDEYGPLPAQTRAILRTKTLLGETYIELTPGPRDGPKVEDGGTLPVANVAESVQLDEIFRTFDPKTRAAFRTWMQDSAVAIAGQGQGLSYGLGELDPFFSEFDKLFRILDTQRTATAQLFRNGSVSLRALRGREGQLAGLIRNSDRVFTPAGQRDRDIEDLFKAFPTFLDESRATLGRLRTFALNADPLMKQLVPAAEELSPLFIAFGELAPQQKGFFEGFAPVIAKAPVAFPALRKLFRDKFPPLLRAIDPFFRNLNPILTGLGLYKREVTGLFGNIAAATNAILVEENTRGEKLHYVRVMGPLNPETVASYPQRLTNNRNSAYSPPGWAEGLTKGLPSFSTAQCSSGITATLDPETPNDPAFKERTRVIQERKDESVVREGFKPKDEALEFFNRLKKYAFAEQDSTASVPAPGCTQQSPFKSIYGDGSTSTYQRTFEQTGK